MEDSTLHSFNHPSRSTLGQRLQRRLIEPAGVINTQQLHCHYQGTQKTAGPLIQRLALPEQVKFRYGSGVLQPNAIVQSLQRRRTESADVFNGQFQEATPYVSSTMGETVQRSIQPQPRQFQNSKEINRRNPNRLGRSKTHPLQPSLTQKTTVMTQPLVKATDHNPLKNQASLVEHKPQSDLSTSFNPPKGEKSRVQTYQQLRIDRKATFSEVNALSRHPSDSGQRQVETHVNANSTVDPSGALSPPSPQKSSSLRISRKANTSAVQVSNLGARGEGESKSPKSQDWPQAQATRQLSAITVQTKADPSVHSNRLVTRLEPTTQPKNNPPLVKGTIQTKAAETQSQSTVSPRSIVPVIPPSQSLPLSLQKQQENLVASNPTVASTKLTQLSSSSELNRVLLKSADGIEVSEGRSTQTPYRQKMPLALPLARISTNGAIAKRLPEGQIARQTNAVDHSTVQLAMPRNAPTLMSSPEPGSVSGSASPIDITKVAEQVSRILARQLAVERERRGIGR